MFINISVTQTNIQSNNHYFSLKSLLVKHTHARERQTDTEELQVTQRRHKGQDVLVEKRSERKPFYAKLGDQTEAEIRQGS